MNVHNKLEHMKLLQANIIDRYPDLDIHVFCNCNESDRDSFSGLRERYFDWEKNTGHHNGVRDAFNCVKDRFSESDYEYIIFSHADNLWSDIGQVEEIVRRMRLRDCGFAYLDALGDVGAMGTKNYFGYFADFVVFSTQTLRDLPRIEEKLDGAIWIEVTLARIVDKLLPPQKKFAVSCEIVDRGTKNLFDKILDVDEWMSAAHSVGEKLDKLRGHNSELHDRLVGMIK